MMRTLIRTYGEAAAAVELSAMSVPFYHAHEMAKSHTTLSHTTVVFMTKSLYGRGQFLFSHPVATPSCDVTWNDYTNGMTGGEWGFVLSSSTRRSIFSSVSKPYTLYTHTLSQTKE